MVYPLAAFDEPFLVYNACYITVAELMWNLRVFLSSWRQHT